LKNLLCPAKIIIGLLPGYWDECRIRISPFNIESIQFCKDINKILLVDHDRIV